MVCKECYICTGENIFGSTAAVWIHPTGSAVDKHTHKHIHTHITTNVRMKDFLQIPRYDCLVRSRCRSFETYTDSCRTMYDNYCTVDREIER